LCPSKLMLFLNYHCIKIKCNYFSSQIQLLILKIIIILRGHEKRSKKRYVALLEKYMLFLIILTY